MMKRFKAAYAVLCSKGCVVVFSKSQDLEDLGLVVPKGGSVYMFKCPRADVYFQEPFRLIRNGIENKLSVVPKEDNDA